MSLLYSSCLIIYYFKIGSAYIYVTSDSGSTWSQRSKVVASDGAADDWFGWSVSIYASIAVIGSRYDDDKGSESGNSHIDIC